MGAPPSLHREKPDGSHRLGHSQLLLAPSCPGDQGLHSGEGPRRGRIFPLREESGGESFSCDTQSPALGDVEEVGRKEGLLAEFPKGPQALCPSGLCLEQAPQGPYNFPC